MEENKTKEVVENDANLDVEKDDSKIEFPIAGLIVIGVLLICIIICIIVITSLEK